MKLAILAGALAATLFGGPALGQTPDDARFAATTLDVSGHGEVRVPPDKATLSLGVVAQGASAVEAIQADAAAMTKVVTQLRAGGVAAADIQTSTLSLSPQYAYAQGQAPRLTGYEADNQVTVTVEDLTHLGSVVDAVVSAGATNVAQIRFGLKAPGAAQTYARLAAVKDLDDKAAIYADAAGYHIRRLVSLKEVAAASPTAPRVMALAAAQPAATPVEPGDILVTVDVIGEFELAH